MGRLRARDEHRADHEVGPEHEPLDRERRAHHRLDPPLPDPVDVPQAVHVSVDDGHLGLHPRGDLRRVRAGHAGAQHHDAGRRHARGASHQHAPAAPRTLERRGALLRRHPPGDLGHRREERQPPVGEHHGLVRDRADPSLGEEPRRGLVGREVQVGEQQLALPEALVLRRLGLLDLHDQVGGREDRVGVGEDLGARRRRTSLVIDRGADARRPSPRPRRGPRGRASRTPSGVAATRYSWSLTSFGMPTITGRAPPGSVEGRSRASVLNRRPPRLTGAPDARPPSAARAPSSRHGPCRREPRPPSGRRAPASARCRLPPAPDGSASTRAQNRCTYSSVEPADGVAAAEELDGGVAVARLLEQLTRRRR